MAVFNEQEKFWSGKFGNKYQERNNEKKLLDCKQNMFKEVFKNIRNADSLIELGANIGMNIKAIKKIYKGLTDIRAIEINNEACKILRTIENCDVLQKSIIDYNCDKKFDICLTMGLLIHIQPSLLPKIYDILYNSSKKYICIAEYYDPNPVSIKYRGHINKLFKRDFAGEMMDKFPDLKLVDYNFIYKRDNKYPLDDITWFLLEKKS